MESPLEFADHPPNYRHAELILPESSLSLPKHSARSEHFINQLDLHREHLPAIDYLVEYP